MFPGQGSQTLGMGMDLYEHDRLARDTFDEASAVLGQDLVALCADGPAELLDRTDLAQAALLTHSIAAVRLLRRNGLEFDAAFGHSLGEYTALVATGALGFAQAVGLVHARGLAMLEAARRSPGGMVAVLGLDDDAVEALCAELDGVWPANFNSPGQVVVSGREEALGELAERARAAGARRVVPLKVSGAFHSPLIESALEPLGDALAAAEWSTPDPRFYSVCSLDFEREGFRDLLLRQLVSPVRFTQAVRALRSAGYDSFLEVGPGSVLGGLVKRIVPEAATASAGDLQSVAALRSEPDGRGVPGATHEPDARGATHEPHERDKQEDA
jgi:[acyl-carrier-protein] S-malonyltransferase